MNKDKGMDTGKNNTRVRISIKGMDTGNKNTRVRISMKLTVRIRTSVGDNIPIRIE